MSPADEEKLLDYLSPPPEKREEARKLIPDLERLVPNLVKKWLNGGSDE